MKAIEMVGFVEGKWLRKNMIVTGGWYRVHDGGINVDGVRFAFEDPQDAYPPGTLVAVRIFAKRRQNYCQTMSEYEQDEKQRREARERYRRRERARMEAWLRSTNSEE